jgi:hypothetical protein
MKITLLLSLLAASLVFASCGGSKKTAKNKPFPEQVADCVCGQITEMAKLKKELDAAPEDKKAEIIAKIGEFKEPACLKDLEAQVEALPQADQEKLEGEVKAAMEKKCGDALKTLGGM